VETVRLQFSEHPMMGEIGLTGEQSECFAQAMGLFGGNPLDILEELRTSPPEEVVERILKSVGIEISPEQKKMIGEKIIQVVVARIQRLAVEKKITQMGFEVKPGGMWSWGDSLEITDQTRALGAELEVPVMAHAEHVTSKVRADALRLLWHLLDDRKDPRERTRDFRKGQQIIREEYMPRVSQDTRRMLYLAGVI